MNIRCSAFDGHDGLPLQSLPTGLSFPYLSEASALRQITPLGTSLKFQQIPASRCSGKLWKALGRERSWGSLYVNSCLPAIRRAQRLLSVKRSPALSERTQTSLLSARCPVRRDVETGCPMLPGCSVGNSMLPASRRVVLLLLLS